MLHRPDHGEDSYHGLGRLTDKVALITGGDSGIGKAVAIAFAREGADLLLSYLPEEEQDANDTAAWIEKAGRKAVKLPGDLQQEAHCNNIVDQAFQNFGKLDLLVNVAASR
jgi:NAD(P)-dependent dehydrogenase (short-subunit alcohol dehydrogenase family)